MICFFFQTRACEIFAPQPGIELALPALESEVLTTEPPGKSHISSFKNVVCTILDLYWFLFLAPVWLMVSFFSPDLCFTLCYPSLDLGAVSWAAVPSGSQMDVKKGRCWQETGRWELRNTGYLFPGLPQPDQWGCFSPLRFSEQTAIRLTWTDKWKLFSRVWLFVTPWTIQSMEFSRPESWSG